MCKPISRAEDTRRKNALVNGIKAGKSLQAIARELAINPGSVHWILKKHRIDVLALSPNGKRVHGNCKGLRAPRPTTTAGRLAARQTTYNLGSKTEDWQTADPSQFPDDIITEAQRMLKCDQRHAAWLLSCPKGGNASGWRGGSAIG